MSIPQSAGDRVAYYRAEMERCWQVIELIDGGERRFFLAIGAEPILDVTVARRAELVNHIGLYNELIALLEGARD